MTGNKLAEKNRESSEAAAIIIEINYSLSSQFHLDYYVEEIILILDVNDLITSVTNNCITILTYYGYDI